MDNLIVIRVDGGICSQINFNALGMLLAHRGYRVKYDLSWFRDCGKDVDGRYARCWDFPKAFPGFPVEEVETDELADLPVTYCEPHVEVARVCAPTILAGYPSTISAVDWALPRLRQLFQPLLAPEDRAVADGMVESLSCAIHVRRGDLAVKRPGYGTPPTATYFEKSVRIVAALCPGVRFYLFSDEPDWVKSELVPQLPRTHSYVVMDANGSDRGWVDLYLMSRCAAVIGSNGSLGIMAAFLSSACPLLLVPNGCGRIFARRPNVIYINDDIAEIRREDPGFEEGNAREHLSSPWYKRPLRWLSGGVKNGK